VKVLSSIKEYKASDPIGKLYYQMTLNIQTREDIIHIAKYFLAHTESKASDPIDKFYYQMNLILQMVVEQCVKLGVTSSW
jgi:phage gp36-like protein